MKLEIYAIEDDVHFFASLRGSITMQRGRLQELDSIRGLAAISVVLYHYFYRYNEIYGHQQIDTDWIAFGHYGVQLFFIVSGFVIYWTLERTEKPADFLISRFSRLYPVFWVSAALTFILVSLFGLPGREIQFVDALKNALMFHERLHVPHVDGVYWTLTVELTFYCFIFALYITSNLRHVTKLFLVASILSTLSSLGVVTINQPYFDILIFEHIPFFLAGICLFKITRKDKVHENYAIIAAAIVSTLITHSFNASVFFALSVVFFILSVNGRLPFMKSRPLVFIGSISYALYLCHQNIGYMIINHAYAHGLSPLSGIVFSVILSVLLAIALTYCIERPALRAIKKSITPIKIRQRAGRLLPAVLRAYRQQN